GWNHYAEKVFGWSSYEAVGNDFFIFTAPPAPYETPSPLPAADGVPVHEIRTHSNKQGSTITCEWSHHIGRDGKGTMTGAVSVGNVTRVMGAIEPADESSRFLQALIDSIPDPIYYKDGNGKYLNCNKAFAMVLGKEREQIVGRTVFDLHPLDLARHYQEKDSQLFQNPGVQTYEASFMYADGMRHDVIFVKGTFLDKEGAIGGLIGVIRDITERRRAETRLSESEERYRIAIEHSNDGVGILKGDHHVYVNQRYLEIFGYDKVEEPLKKNIFNTVHPDDREKVRAINRARQKGEPVPSRYEFKGVRKDGSPIHVEVSATEITYRDEPAGLVYLRDVTERKIALDKLQESESKYRTLFDHATAAIFIVKDDQFIDCNQKALTVFDCSREEIMAQTAFRFAPSGEGEAKDPSQRLRERFAAALAGQTQFFESKAVRYDGSPFDAEISLSRIELEGEYMLQVIIQDITQRKETERELETKSLSLEEVNVALRVLLRQREKDKNEVGDHILRNVEDLVLPYIDILKQRRMDEQQNAYLNVLEINLKNIISPFMHRLTSVFGGFTPAEIKVANFIREGKTIKEIARIIGVSESSVNTHRQHIRNKLGLANRKTNLRTYLMSLSR
ncbi:MAG TPA: PAS domain S-box protein, partial [Syntrophorhabdaceae bacterium]